jgi:acyl-coenzyme A thioesterase PaaI-like protein
MKTVGERLLEEELKILEKTGKMEKELRSYGTKIHGGYIMTVGDMLKYFEKIGKQKRR